MIFTNKHVNNRGFGHIELVIFIVVVGLVISIANYVYGNRVKSASAASYTTLSNINFGGQVFKEQACSTAIGFGNYVISAIVSTTKAVGPTTSPLYNPLAIYQINTPMPVSQNQDKWVTGKTSYISFSLPKSLGTNTFNLGIKGYLNGKLIAALGSTNNQAYTIKSIPPCNPNAPPPPNSATCDKTPVNSTVNPVYPWVKTSNFMQSSTDWVDYGDGIQNPRGYVAASHAVFIPGIGLEIKGYPDKIGMPSSTGVVGGSGDVNVPINGSGGFDACFSMTGGNWQKVSLSFISWSTSTSIDAWNQGELDIFEGSPQSLGINLHEIGPSPVINVWQGGWPTSLADGGIHLISARWDPTNGYNFYLDGNFVINLPISCLASTDPNYNPDCVQAPTTPHHLSIQMRDTNVNSTSKETAIIYWTAAYNYQPSPSN